MGQLLQEALPASTVIVAVDPGKVTNRVWVSSGASGLLHDPLSLSLSLPVLRSGLEQVSHLVQRHGAGAPPV